MKHVEHPGPVFRRAATAAVCACALLLAVAPAGYAQSTMDVLHSFGAPALPATPSYGTLLEMPDGSMYGTTTAGAGAIFKLSPDGLGGFALSVLHSFSGPDGRLPYGGLIDGGDGLLYGTTFAGGAAEAGTVFRIDPAGRLTTLHSFAHVDGAHPFAGLLDGGDGFLYGTTYNGSVFKVDRRGASFTNLRTLTLSDGVQIYGGLVRGNDGFLYGTTYRGYVAGANYGTLFRIGTNGLNFEVLHRFLPATGSEPMAGLLKAADGKLYGTTTSGGSSGDGAVFRFDPTAGSYTLLHSLSGSEGTVPAAALVQGSDGQLYGTARDRGEFWRGSVFKVDPTTDPAGFTRLASFSAPLESGAHPLAALMKASDGHLYGTTSTEGPRGSGTVFRIHEDGTGLEVVAAFDASTIDGASPQAGVVGADGWYYGTTVSGGAFGAGTVFRMAADGSTYTTLHSFDGASDGALPSGPLLLRSDGLYGVANARGPGGEGTVFRLSTDGSSFEVLHAFQWGSAGRPFRPVGGLVEGGDGFLYGMTAGSGSDGASVYRLDTSTWAVDVVQVLPGGSEPIGPLWRKGSVLVGATRIGGDFYAGSLFRLDVSGFGYRTLHSFNPAASQGRYPNGGLVEGSDGLLYGTTRSDGASGNGTLFRIAADGASFETLRVLVGTDGRSPDGPLVAGDSGFLYGTTNDGGEGRGGTAFALRPAVVPAESAFSLLYSFSGRDGRGMSPAGPLLQAGDGRLIGVTQATGGTDGPTGGGTVYRLSPPAHVQPTASVTLCRDESGPTLAAVTVGPARSYQWGYRSPYDTRVTALVGQTGPTYTVNGADFPASSYDTVFEVVCTIRYAGDHGESTSNAVTITVKPPCGGGSAAPPPVQIFTATTGRGSSSTTLHWVNPSTAVEEVVIRYRTDGTYPTSAGDTSAPLLCGSGASSCGSAASDAIGTFVHEGQTPGTTYTYGVFTRSLTASSGGRFASATPFDGPTGAAWAYSTGATSVVPPGLRPAAGSTPGAVYTVSNDRGLHAMTLGATGGDWPAGWKPLLMNAPSQGRPIPVNFPSFTVNGIGKVVYVTSQDGRVYVADALTGALLRASAQICQGIQHSPGAMFRDYGGAYDVLIVGSRNTSTAVPATNSLFGLDPATLAVRWTFDNGAGANGIGIISGQPLVDYATRRVYFTSRQLEGGSGSSVWCLSFTDSGATKVWEANVGSVDASASLWNGTLYVGNLDGRVYALNASDGSFKWTAPFVTGDGPVRSLVWTAGTGNRLFFSTTTKSWAITDNGPGTAPTAYWTPPPAVTSPSNPLVSTDKAYVGNGAGQLLQFDATTPTPPAPLGVTLTPQPQQVGRPTMDWANGVIYVGTDGGRVHAVSYPF